MKKIISLIIAMILLISSVHASFAMTTMYAPDGRTANINDNDVQAWKNVGWYDYPVATVYAPDGRYAVISKNAVQSWKNVGWYDYPVATVYAPDGRTAVISKNAVQDWKNVGWYDYPVVTVYAPDGRTAVISKNALNDWLKVGWYVMPEYSFIYKTGYVPYDAKIHEYYNAMFMDAEEFNMLDWSSINSLMVHYARGDYYEPGKLYYALYDIDNNGIPELMFSEGRSFIDLYTLNNGRLVKVFKDCFFGERVNLYILSDGTLLEEGSSGASTSSGEVYRFGSDGSLLQLESFYYDSYGPSGMDGTYMSVSAYVDKVNKLKAQSIFDYINWNHFVSGKKR